MFFPPSAFELPDGRLVCEPHRLVVCPMCTVDYSFMEEDRDSDDDASVEQPVHYAGLAVLLPVLPAGTGRALPIQFHPRNRQDTPQSLFPPGIGRRASPVVSRFINRHNRAQFLIYTDGACLDNGRVNSRAGCAFVFKPSAHEPSGYVRFPLEKKGPTGETHAQTSNRAELRAVVAALAFRYWPGEGCESLVIATDSEYVVQGVTSWVRGWRRRNWRTISGAAVKNRDLWERLLEEIDRYKGDGMDVEFWRIPRGWNADADYHAKRAASENRREEFSDVKGVLC